MQKKLPVCLLLTVFITLSGCVPVKRTSSGNNDQGYGQPYKPEPPPLNARINASKKDLIILKSWPNAADNKEKIKICLVNNTAKGHWKAMYYKDGKPPKKFQAKGKGSQSCAHYYAGQKTFYFWRSGFLGKRKMINTYNIDLSAYTGHQLNFEWIRD